MAFPKVYVNGQLAGEWDYGYMSFRIDATPYIRFGEKNIIAVQVDTRKHGTRWYPGAGIYRKVTMTICNPVHIAHWGTYITTPKITNKSATVQVRSTIENHLEMGSDIQIEIKISDPDGHLTTKSHQINSIAAKDSQVLNHIFEIKNPQRWDILSPKLYTATTILKTEGKVIDKKEVPFGIRTFEFTANDGFYLNGRRVQLYGVNLHHDHGPLGAAFYTRAMERQLEIMRDMGCNGIRTSHNPPAPELLDLCDRMGFIVLDECFDKWNNTADRINDQPPLEKFGERQIRNFIMRDRNHPCIVVWFIGNEIGNTPWDQEGKSPERVAFMTEFVKKYDFTRPVSIACSNPGTTEQPILDALDLTGWNYNRRYARARNRYPEKPIIYSESASALSTRGFYELPLPKSKTDYSEQLQVNSYDFNAAMWADMADVDFQLMETDTFIAGEFVWTGFDYLGEPTPFFKEARSSYFGIVDLCGIPKDRFYLYRSYWRPDVTTVHILPHWNWPDRIGENVPIFVYTNGDEAELFLNGKSLGRRKKGMKKIKNLAMGKFITTGSRDQIEGNPPEYANDGLPQTFWNASQDTAGQGWQVDLDNIEHIGYIEIDFHSLPPNVQYRILGSIDNTNWDLIIQKGDFPRFSSYMDHIVNIEARYVRIEFTGIQGRRNPSIREIGLYTEKTESYYYAVIDKYRLRWMDVKYQPGELKAVAYKGAQKIGETVIRTADKPAVIRLTPDRHILSATGEYLCYILVEILDAKGTLCPLADNLVQFEVNGPAEIAGVGNGNPLSLEPFQAEFRKLFYGRAMLILRTIEGKTGNIRVNARADGLKTGDCIMISQ